MKKVSILTMLPIASLADSNVAGNYYHLGFGYKKTHYIADSIDPYTDNKYLNHDSKKLG